MIGVVENMAALTLPDGTVLDLFGSGGGAEVARALSTDATDTSDAVDVPLLASIPLSPALRQGGDTGEPVVLARPDDVAAQAIIALARDIAQHGRSLVGRSLPLRLN